MKYTRAFPLVFSFLIARSCGVIATAEEASTFSPADISALYRASVVVLYGGSSSDDITTLGTGFFVSHDGLLVTNYHVIEAVKHLKVKLSNGDIFDRIKVVDYDERRDIVVLSVPAYNTKPVQLGDSDTVSPGDKIVVIGNPEGFEGSVTDGIVSGIRVSEKGYRLIQISAPISPGSSGSPVFDAKGKVIGLAVGMVKEAQNLNFAVPVNYVRPLITSENRIPFEQFVSSVAGVSTPSNRGNAAAKDGNTGLWCGNFVIALREFLQGKDAVFAGCMDTFDSARTMAPGQISISPSLHISLECFRRAEQRLDASRPRAEKALKLHESFRNVVRLYREAAEGYVAAFSLVEPVRGWSEFNKVYAAANAKEQLGSQDLFAIDGGFPLGVLRVLEECCANLEGSLPTSVRDLGSMWPSVFLGFNPYWSKERPVVLSVNPGGPAERAGLKRDDEIHKIGGSGPIRSWSAFREAMQGREPGDEVAIEVLRKGELKRFKIKLERPAWMQ